MPLTDFPGGPVVYNPPTNAGDMGPWSGEDSTCCGQQSINVQTAEPVHPRAHALQQEKLPQCETCAPKLPNSPCLPQLEKAYAQ